MARGAGKEGGGSESVDCGADDFGTGYFGLVSTKPPAVDLSRRHFDLDLLGSGFIRTCFWVLKSGLAPPGFWYCMFCDLVAFRIYPGNYNN